MASPRKRSPEVKKLYDQRVVKLEWEDIPGQGVSNGRYKPITLDKQPSRVWTFLLYPDAPLPTLPVFPVHNHNVFMEDWVHDWNYDERTKGFRYYTRIFDKRDVWILLEYEKK